MTQKCTHNPKCSKNRYISGCIYTPQHVLNNPVIDKGTKYKKTIKDAQSNSISVDVYDVLKAFSVHCPALQHAIKKLLCAGARGHKDTVTDLNEAINSIHRAKELLDDSHS